jgi:hypothetical protein
VSILGYSQEENPKLIVEFFWIFQVFSYAFTEEVIKNLKPIFINQFFSVKGRVYFNHKDLNQTVYYLLIGIKNLLKDEKAFVKNVSVDTLYLFMEVLVSLMYEDCLPSRYFWYLLNNVQIIFTNLKTKVSLIRFRALKITTSSVSIVSL